MFHLLWNGGSTNLHFQFVYYLVLGLKISSQASRAQKASTNILKGVRKPGTVPRDALPREF